MNKPIVIRIDGEVERPVQLRFEDLAAIAPPHQVPDVRQIDPKRGGGAVRLAGLLELVRVKDSATYLGLHSSTDDFHASIPLAAVRERALLIYRSQDNRPLDLKSGGPARFFIPDHAACHTDEIDECANVKFVDHMELTTGKGFDNRPLDDAQHQRLHQQQDQ